MSCLCDLTRPIPQCIDEIIVGYATPLTDIRVQFKDIITGRLQSVEATTNSAGLIIVDVEAIQEFFSPNFIYEVRVFLASNNSIVEFLIDGVLKECLQVPFESGTIESAQLQLEEDTELYLILQYNDIENVPVDDPTSVTDWNTFFDLPDNGNPFTSVIVFNNLVMLGGGSNITLPASLFENSADIISFTDNLGCITGINGNYTFSFCTNLTSVHLPALTYCNGNSIFDTSGLEGALSFPSLIYQAGAYFLNATQITSFSAPKCVGLGSQALAETPLLESVSLASCLNIGTACMFNAVSLTSVSLPVCTNLGGSVLDNQVFDQVTGNNITLTIPAALMTCNSGNPDGDIEYLQANNTVTIVQV